MMKLLLFLTLSAFAGEPSDIKARAEAVVAIDRNRAGGDAVIAKIADSFKLIRDEELESHRLKGYDTRTLEVLFEAVSAASEHMPRPESLKVLEGIFNECLSRGYYGEMPDRLYSHYIAQRLWAKARGLNERFPREPRALPNVVEPAHIPDGIPAVYEVSEDGKTLTYKRIELAGPIIISAVSPGCHFSADAVGLIEADPKLSAIFRDHAVNIEAAPYDIDAAEIARVNRKGRFRYDILYKGSAWKGFDFSTTPRFYFVKDGKIIAHMTGDTAPSEFKRKLAESIKRIGLQ